MNSAQMHRALGGLGKGFTPKNLRPHLRSYFQKAGHNNVPYAKFAIFILLSLVVAVFVFSKYILPLTRNINIASQFVVSFVSIAVISVVCVGLVGMCLYFYYDLKIYKRTKEMEAHLPDYLQVVSTNLRGGMSFEKSLFAAIKPQFGVLAQEMTRTSKKVLTGYDLSSALEEFAAKYDSPELKRSMNLIVGETATGGKVAYVIDEIVSNLKQTQKLKAEMSASVVTYVIFIGAIVVVIAPALFALSYNLLNYMAQFTDKLADAGISNVNLPFSFTKGAIKPEFFKTFSWIATLVVAFFSAMIVSIIEKGHVKAGLKYIPMFTISALVMYFLFMAILSRVFATLVI